MLPTRFSRYRAADGQARLEDADSNACPDELRTQIDLLEVAAATLATVDGGDVLSYRHLSQELQQPLQADRVWGIAVAVVTQSRFGNRKRAALAWNQTGLLIKR